MAENKKITLEDLNMKLSQINQALAREIRSRQFELLAGGVAVVAAAVYLSYFIGKRRGRRG